MKPFIYLFVLFAFVNNALTDAEKCTEEDAEECLTDLMRSLHVGEGNAHEHCSELRRANNCLVNVANKCLDADERAEVQDTLDEMTQIIDAACASQHKDENYEYDISEEDKEMINCVISTGAEIESIVEGCGQTINNPSGLHSPSARCRAFLSNAECISRHFGDKCGEEAEKHILAGMMDALAEEDGEETKQVRCAKAISEAKENEYEPQTRKRRTIRSLNLKRFV